MSWKLACTLAALGASASLAEEGAYLAMAGPAAAVRLSGGGQALGAGLLLKSAYGLSDSLNWEGPVLIELTGPQSALLGTGLEYVFFSTNHWRLNAGMGGALLLPFQGGGSAGPYAEAAVRWAAGWGVGVSLELHAQLSWTLARGEREVSLVPALAAYLEI